MKEFNRKRGIAAAPVVAEYNKWKSQLKPYETSTFLSSQQYVRLSSHRVRGGMADAGA